MWLYIFDGEDTEERLLDVGFIDVACNNGTVWVATVILDGYM